MDRRQECHSTVLQRREQTAAFLHPNPTTESIPVVAYVNRDGPTITGPTRTETGAPAFTIDGNEWAPGHVEWSNDLERWHSLQNISFEETPITVIDENPSSGQRFYRIRIEE